MIKQIGTIAILAAVTGAWGQQAKLKVGSPAPKITVAKWAKGGPVYKPGDGKVHVVEFWATWCGPCIETIPHLSEMAKKYKGKASFSGISVWERESSQSAIFAGVDKFVKNMGPRMNYNVGIDGTANLMAKNWMTAAGQNGIPTAFVVGRDGKVAWIGHPMDGLDEVVGKVVANKYNAKAEAARKDQVEAQQREQMKRMQPLIKAYQAQDWSTVASESERLMKADPKMTNQLAMVRFEALGHTDETKAYAYAGQLAATTFKDQPQMLNGMAWAIVDPEGTMKNPDYNLAVQLAERAAKLTNEKDPNVLDTLAHGLWKKGDKTRAMAVQAKAVKIVNSEPNTPPASKKAIVDFYEKMKKG